MIHGKTIRNIVSFLVIGKDFIEEIVKIIEQDGVVQYPRLCVQVVNVGCPSCLFLRLCGGLPEKRLELRNKYIRWHKGGPRKRNGNHLNVSFGRDDIRKIYFKAVLKRSKGCSDRPCPRCPVQIILADKYFPQKGTGNRGGKIPVNPDKKLIHLGWVKKIETQLSSY